MHKCKWAVKSVARISDENKETEPRRKVTSIYALQVLNFISMFHRCVSNDAYELNTVFACQFT